MRLAILTDYFCLICCYGCHYVATTSSTNKYD